MKTLGIDLGSSSLGWAILSPEKIEDCGVIVFKEGILRTKGVDSLETPAAERRKHRMARRIKFRRRIRKLHVLKLLIENGNKAAIEAALNIIKKNKPELLKQEKEHSNTECSFNLSRCSRSRL